ncbi:MAG: AAA family ATPase [Thaumarchaeota archaeon]|nr:AAA family ATPase [Nitrososphaerota archaeon]
MGTGKTSRLLAVLFALCGEAPSGLTLDDLINTSSDHMLVRVEGRINNLPFYIERRKRRGGPVAVKTDLPEQLKIDPKIFVDGREISKLFVGAPTEKALKLNQLLGFERYDQVASEMTPVPIERRIQELERQLSAFRQIEDIRRREAETTLEIGRIKDRLSALRVKYMMDSAMVKWAEEVRQRAEEAKRSELEIKGKLKLLEQYRSQLKGLPEGAIGVEEELREMEARNDALNRRIAVLEASIKIIDLQKGMNVQTCPLCNAPLSKEALESFKHMEEEYRKVVEEYSSLQTSLTQKRKEVEEYRRLMEQRQFIEAQISRLEDEITQTRVQSVSEEDLSKALQLLKEADETKREIELLESKLSSLEAQKQAYQTALAQLGSQDAASLEQRIRKLKDLADKIKRIRSALIEAVNEAKNERLASIQSSFKEAFKKIYPYERIKDVDFESKIVRGHEVLYVKGKVNESWVYAHQMSTGENVALSFALLLAVNELVSSPLLLLDEPEEGLDESGIRGLAEVLKKMKQRTQLLVATRSPLLASLLRSEGSIE